MENASKALIIAGAILLSILIIGLGMGVYNSSKSAMGGANLDAAELRAHNSQFTAYEGRQKGSEVSALIGTIQSNNNSYEDRQISVEFLSGSTDSLYDPDSGELLDDENDSDPTNAIYNLDGDDSSTLAKIRNKLKPSTTYRVTLLTNDEGLITYCGIEVYKSKTGGTTTNP